MTPFSTLPDPVLFALLAGLALSVVLPLAVVVVAYRGYRRSGGDRTLLLLALGIVLVTALPTLLRIGLATLLGGPPWGGLVVRGTELAGLLVIVGVMFDG